MTTDPDADARRARNCEAIRVMLERFSAGDKEGQLAHVDDDIVYLAPYYAEMAPRRGKAQMRAMLEAVEERFSSILYEVVELFPTTDPDLVVAEVRGDHQVKGAPRRYRNHYVMFMRFRDGKVVEWREFSNPDVYRRAVTGE
ncbi:MAG TPA: nuclear transport factor 2 family protein [Acidimicrobiia bacterium]|nr:nuclear transport factor 2 family protein [Acidimicrobiia bacterium]